MAKTVLLVDDDDDVREIAELMIADLGYDVIAAADGIAALSLAATRPLDALVTDIRMPGMDGYQLAGKVRALQPGIPVICITGYTALGGDQGNCSVLLRKPFRPADLESVLRRLCPN